MKTNNIDEQELLRKIMFNKKLDEQFVPKILLEDAKQTLQEYIAENVYDYPNKYQKSKANIKIECYTDCINLINDLLKKS